jgi:hypothetical protein
MIGIVAVRPKFIFGRQYPFSLQIEPSIIIIWENIPDCSKKGPFLLSFKLTFQSSLQKEKTDRLISYRDKRRWARSADRRLVKKPRVFV